jgi:hypothetical protein
MSAPELSSSARALLDAAREGLSPDAAAISRVRGKVTAAAGGAAASALALKLGLAGVLAIVAVGAIVQHARSESPAMAPRIAIPTATTEATSPPRVHDVAPPLVISDEPAPIEMAAEPMRRTPSLTVDLPADLSREVELIDRAMKALSTNDLSRALATIKLHVAETRGNGQLAEDAAAIEIEALCRMKSPSGTVAAKLDAFDARFPRSAQRSRLSTHCQE